MTPVYSILKERGYIAQVTNDGALQKLLDGGEPVRFYVGFDPTADSLHIGHFIPIMAMARLQRAGHMPIALIGAGTTMVGDPSGRTDMRQMMSLEQISANGERFKEQLSRFLDFGEGKAILVNNADWLLGLNYVEFLRDIGVHFSVNRMLTADCYKLRLEKGLSFIEFNYMLMQSYDFLELHKRYGCALQLGGDDQWSNIISGVDLVRRKEAKEVFGLTLGLLTTTDGVKMGKTQRGALWIDAEKTPPFEFYQYFRNVQDDDVVACLRLLTFLPDEAINEYGRLRGSAINEAKRALAYETTKIVHGEEEAKKCAGLAEGLFGGRGGGTEDLATTAIGAEQAERGVGVVDLLVLCGLAPSRSEARRLVAQGGIVAGGNKISSADHVFYRADFPDEGLLMQKGKKTYHKVIVS
ncbi:MAG: tyrosine--tRNA ligase [Oscillospiraceae bacterium]|nr:tyrosine--tRNA ligase [Oscillospiraceae bacterium]